MSISNLQVEAGPQKIPTGTPPPAAKDYKFTFVESPSLFVSACQQIRDWFREPKSTVPAQYFRGSVHLPATDMRPWFMDLPAQLKVAFEKPADPIGKYNYQQQEKRAVCAIVFGIVLGAICWIWRGGIFVVLGVVAGFVLGELVGALVYKNREYPPDIWRDYRLQAASYVNSVLVHAVALTMLFLPYFLSRLWQPVKAATKPEVVDISPYIPVLPEVKGKKAGGGGGGGDRSPTPASKGAVPKFSRTPLAPPVAVIPNPAPQLPVAPALLGPPELKLPQMSSNMPWGDPAGVIGPASNGPGYGGGIGTGHGGGIGSGSGGGLGPGEGGGMGGGVYSVGGGVSEPIPIYKPDPPYSEDARKAKYQGTVVLFVIIDASGNVAKCQVIKPLGLGLDEKALETVKTWKFKPAMKNGVAVPVQVTVEVSFRLF